MTDTISDFLTRIRNAQAARHRVVEIPSSNLKKAMTQVLFEKGYILNYKFDKVDNFEVIKIALKYNATTKQPAITKLVRVSKPGLRKYAGVEALPRVINGLGIAIMSTS